MKITKDKILKFLRDNPVISISVSKNNKPMASLVLTYTEDNLTKYFACSKNSYKAKALFENPQISWNIWEHENMLIQADGFAEVVESEDIPEVLDKIAGATNAFEEFWPPVLSITDEEYVVFRIKTKWLRAFDVSDLKITENTPPFTILEGKEL